ncbi:MAG: glycosyltransferase family 4 protein, partial [Planctomycetes bacterium]|nr:glycosyltransferase family 4 protein [Planctomycetota bacterium]
MSARPLSRPPVRRVLIECTDTYRSNWNTGIQRVVRNVVRESAAVGAEYGVECRPIIRVGNRYRAVRWKARIARREWKWVRRVKQLRLDPELWDRNDLFRVIHRVAVRIRKIFYPRAVVRKLRDISWSLRGEEIVPGEGDTLVMLDAWWNLDVWSGVEQAKQNGVTIGVVMYDLLPVTHPEYFHSSIIVPFTKSLSTALHHADYFVAISHTVCATLQDYVFRAGHLRLRDPARYSFFRLGSALDIASQKKRVREEVREAFGRGRDRNPYLCVGTIEPRKNHVLLLDAFEQVWKTYPDAQLCLVGRVGWLCEGLLARIWQHPRYNQSLFMFNDLSDAEPTFCYRNAKAFLFPSHAEGFGLPVVEALQYGLRVMVSDIPIHREVGRDYCAYFDLEEPGSLAAMIGDLERSGSFPHVRRPDEFVLYDWAESTRDFIS